MSYFRPAVDALRAYEPGEQPAPDSSATVIKLNTNENPYPPSPRAMAVLRDIDPEQLRRYPDACAAEFRDTAGGRVGYRATFDRGRQRQRRHSDDVDTVGRRHHPAVAYPVPTYALYRTLAQIQNAPVVEVEFEDDYDLPVDGWSRHAPH